MDEEKECVICREEDGNRVFGEKLEMYWCPSSRHRLCKRCLPNIIATYRHCPACFSRFAWIDLLSKDPTMMVFDETVQKKYRASLLFHFLVRLAVDLPAIICKLAFGWFPEATVIYCELVLEIGLQLTAELNNHFFTHQMVAKQYTVYDYGRLLADTAIGTSSAIVYSHFICICLGWLIGNSDEDIWQLVRFLIVTVLRHNYLFRYGMGYRQSFFTGPQITKDRLAQIRYRYDLVSTRKGWMSEETYVKMRKKITDNMDWVEVTLLMPFTTFVMFYYYYQLNT